MCVANNFKPLHSSSLQRAAALLHFQAAQGCSVHVAKMMPAAVNVSAAAAAAAADSAVPAPAVQQAVGPTKSRTAACSIIALLALAQLCDNVL